MRHKFTKLAAVLVVGVMALCVTSCFAEGGDETKGEHTATIPVTLTVIHTAKNIDVTVPAVLPISLVDDKIVTAENVAIKNNNKSFGVEVERVNVENGLYEIVDYDSSPTIGQNQLALQLNGIGTKGPGALDITKEAFPDLLPEDTLSIAYDAKVSDSADVSDLEIAHVVFTLKAIIPQG